MSTGCLFCNIVARSIPAQIIHENDHVLAFRDIHPAAPTHALVIPKRHVTGVHDATPDDVTLLGQILLAGRDVAEALGLANSGYRLVMNQGPDGGQSVFHLHCHVMGGRPMGWPPG
jgi:histidine triad (HIT) family protein